MLSTLADTVHREWFLEEKANMLKMGVLTPEEAEGQKLWMGNVFETFRIPGQPRNEIDIGLRPSHSKLPTVVVQSCVQKERHLALEEVKSWLENGKGSVKKVILYCWDQNGESENEVSCSLEVYSPTESGNGVMERLDAMHVLPANDSCDPLQRVKINISDLLGSDATDGDRCYMFSLERFRKSNERIVEAEKEFAPEARQAADRMGLPTPPQSPSRRTDEYSETQSIRLDSSTETSAPSDTEHKKSDDARNIDHHAGAGVQTSEEDSPDHSDTSGTQAASEARRRKSHKEKEKRKDKNKDGNTDNKRKTEKKGKDNKGKNKTKRRRRCKGCPECTAHNHGPGPVHTFKPLFDFMANLVRNTTSKTEPRRFEDVSGQLTAEDVNSKEVASSSALVNTRSDDSNSAGILPLWSLQMPFFRTAQEYKTSGSDIREDRGSWGSPQSLTPRDGYKSAFTPVIHQIARAIIPRSVGTSQILRGVLYGALGAVTWACFGLASGPVVGICIPTGRSTTIFIGLVHFNPNRPLGI